MIDPSVRLAADWFWRQALAAPYPMPLAFPRELETPATLVLRVSIHRLPTLDGASVQGFIARRRLDLPTDNLTHHCFRGVLLAAKGHGYILLDASDDADEIRFSLAHEIAHFIVDYWWPRDHALRTFGETIRDVLDGRRAPTSAEHVHATLSGVYLDRYQHITARTAVSGLPFDYDPVAEDRADQLALELVAPWEDAASMAAPMMRGRAPHVAAQAVTARLCAHFGLPKHAATAYADALTAQLWRPPTYHDMFGRKK